MTHDMFLLSLAMCLTWAPYTLAYPCGAPDSVCDNMTPVHNALSQSSDPPFTLIASPTSIHPGGSVLVTLKGTLPFRGFQIRSLMKSGFSNGTFTANQHGSLRCRNKGVTHVNNDIKNSVAFGWILPKVVDYRWIFFEATVVVNKSTFWTFMKSNNVYITATSIAPATTSTRTPYTGVIGPINWKTKNASSKHKAVNRGNSHIFQLGIETLLTVLSFIAFYCFK